jgi:hypothetical protein
LSETEHSEPMTELKTSSPLLRAARRDIEPASSTTLLQLSIVAALATVSVIACMKWLLS